MFPIRDGVKGTDSWRKMVRVLDNSKIDMGVARVVACMVLANNV